MTELDDAIEQVLGKYIPDTIWRIQARNEICALISQAGGDVFAPVEFEHNRVAVIVEGEILDFFKAVPPVGAGRSLLED